ncbi:HAD family hydrolase [Arenibacter palladensis]|uniref:HAD family hydrolase n=1 Tax=Arenibacter palladensis TaxID=237373 RepID=UPI002FD26D68
MDIKIDHKTVIVFDLDDTLYNEIEYLKSAYLEIAQKLDKENYLPLYAHMFSLFRNNKNVFDFLSEQFKVSKSQLLTDYRAHKPKIKLFDGALSILKNIKKYNGKIGLITDGRTTTQTNKIHALGLSPLLDQIVISEEIGSEKPHPNNFKVFESRYGKASYYYIADNIKKDFLTPNALGWRSIGLIDNGLNMHSDRYLYLDKEYQPQNMIISLSDLNISPK